MARPGIILLPDFVESLSIALHAEIMTSSAST